MSILSIALRLNRRQQPYSKKTNSLYAKPNLLLQVVTLAFVSLTILTVSTITVATTISPLQLIFELPQEYLPGNPLPPLPKDVECSIEHVYVACPVPVLDKEVNLYLQQGTHMLTSATIRVYEYSIGELIASWGTPTGMAQYDSLINVYWGKRFALIYTRSFRPDNRVTFIGYDFDAPRASPWRGFTGHKH